MRKGIDDPLPLRDFIEDPHINRGEMARRSASVAAGVHELRKREVGGKSDSAIKALARWIERVHDIANCLRDRSGKRTQLVGRQALRSTVAILIRTTERDHQTTFDEHRSQAKRGAQIGFNLVDARTVWPLWKCVDRARRATQKEVHRCSARFITVRGGSRILWESCLNVAS
jgi:hypothetical protein